MPTIEVPLNLAVHDPRFPPASAMQVASGLPAWLEFKYGLLAIDDVTLRGTQAGNLSLSFPQPTDEGGREHATVRRYSNAARIELERQIFAVLEKRYKRAS